MKLIDSLKLGIYELVEKSDDQNLLDFILKLLISES
jgi:hypothetical protein